MAVRAHERFKSVQIPVKDHFYQFLLTIIHPYHYIAEAAEMLAADSLGPAPGDAWILEYDDPSPLSGEGRERVKS